MMTSSARVSLVVLVLAGCYRGADTSDTDVDGGSDAGSTGGPAGTTAPASSTAATTMSMTTSVGDDTGGGSSADGSGGVDATTGADPSQEVCARWLADRADMSEGTWSGEVASCDPGDVAATGRTNALRVLNLYRWLADLPAIELDEGRNELGQACALMMHANGQLSHMPPMSWTCYSGDGAMAAGNSNIASTAAVAAIDLYMVDPGNPETLGHRRWILSNSIGPTGIGSTDAFSCLWTLGGSGTANAPWTAYPSPGVYPIGAASLSFTSLDETGWSIQSDSIDLAPAQVEITADGTPQPVTVHVLQSGYGSNSAISMIPMGWQITAGVRYHVEVTGTSTAIAYDVDVVDCGG